MRPFSIGVDERLKWTTPLKFTKSFSYAVVRGRIFQEIKIMDTNRSLLTFSNQADNRPTFVSVSVEDNQVTLEKKEYFITVNWNLNSRQISEEGKKNSIHL